MCELNQQMCELFLFCVCLCYIVLSVSCSVRVTCWERAELFTLLYVMFSCVFVTFTDRILVQVWYLIVSSADLSLLPYFCCQLQGKMCAQRTVNRLAKLARKICG